MFKDFGTAILYFFVIILPFLALSIFRQKLLHGVSDAKDLVCRLGFHKLERQKLKDNNFLGRSQCLLCGYIPKDQ